MAKDVSELSFNHATV